LPNRSFSSSPNIVNNAVSYYLKGIKEYELLVIGKHLVGLGGIPENTHKIAKTIYAGNIDELKKDIYPFSNLLPYLDGIMTSHIIVNQIENKIPITFSKITLDSIKKIGKFNSNINTIFITDDLSDMSGVLNYKKDNRLSFSKLAIEAFDAGHDILLFSGIEFTKDKKKCKSINKEFYIDSLYVVKKNLVEHIKKNGENKRRYIEALTKILIKKEIFFSKILNDSSIIKKNGNYFNRNIPSGIDFNESKIEEGYTIKNIIKETLRKTSIIVNNKFEYRINQLSDSKILFVVDESLYKYIVGYNLGRNNIYDTIIKHKNSYKNAEVFDSFVKKTIKKIKENDIIFFDITNQKAIDELNFVKAFLNDNSLVNKKIILLHGGNPRILPKECFNNFTVISTMCNTDLALDHLSKIIFGIEKPNDIGNLAIDIDEHHKAEDVAYVKPVVGIPNFQSKSKSEQNEEIISLERKVLIVFYLFVIYVLMLCFVLIYIYKHYCKKQKIIILFIFNIIVAFLTGMWFFDLLILKTIKNIIIIIIIIIFGCYFMYLMKDEHNDKEYKEVLGDIKLVKLCKKIKILFRKRNWEKSIVGIIIIALIIFLIFYNFNLKLEYIKMLINLLTF